MTRLPPIDDARTHLALALTRMAVWDVDLDTRAMSWSETAADVFGMPTDDLPASIDTFIGLIHEHDRTAVAHEMDRAIRERADWTAEFRTSHHDGGVRWLAMRDGHH